jgi:hypothetical protein
MYIEIPEIPSCIWEDPRSKTVENVLTTPFFPKTFSDPITAHACQVEIEFIRTFMGFWGTKSVLNRGREYRKLDMNDCLKEAMYMRNGVSQLKEIGHNIFSNDTSQLMEEYHWCCKEQLLIRYRIIFKKIKIRFNFHNRKIITSSFSTENCDMDSYFCELPTVTIVWQASSNDTCSLKEGNQVLGQCLGNKELTKFTIVSEIGQFAVSGYRKTINKCGMELYETQEGIYLRIDQVNITASMAKVLFQHEHHPIQTTNELALISYVARELENLIYDLYRKTWLNICYLTQQRLISIKQLAKNPQQAYVAARMLMRTENLMAHSAGEYLSAYECDIVESYFLETMQKCYKSIPIKYTLYDKEFKRFLLPTTKDIISLDAEVTCGKPIKIFLKDVNKTTNQIYVWNGSALAITTLNNTVSIQLIDRIPNITYLQLISSRIVDNEISNFDTLTDLLTSASSMMLAIAHVSNMDMTSLDTETFIDATSNTISMVKSAVSTVIDAAYPFVNYLHKLFVAVITIIVIIIIAIITVKVHYHFKSVESKRNLINILHSLGQNSTSAPDNVMTNEPSEIVTIP